MNSSISHRIILAVALGVAVAALILAWQGLLEIAKVNVKAETTTETVRDLKKTVFTQDEFSRLHRIELSRLRADVAGLKEHREKDAPSLAESSEQHTADVERTGGEPPASDSVTLPNSSKQ